MSLFAMIVIQIVVAVALAVVAHLFAPKPSDPQSDATRDLEAPTADAGRPVPVVFGEVTVKGPNCLGYWEISKQTVKVKV